MDWSKIPDILAIASLAFAFASISRRNQTPQHRLWLVGWILICAHFMAFVVATVHGFIGTLGDIVGLTTLVSAGIFFMWATVPAESEISSRRMATVVLLSTATYAGMTCLEGIPTFATDLAACFISLGPLSVGIAYRRNHQHALRWMTVTLQFLLGCFLLGAHHMPGGGNPDLDGYAILFTIYIGCCLYFWQTHKRSTTGSIITVCGFFAWAMVFVIGPGMDHYFPNYHLEGEVWNLPKYVVAVGMLLLLLEKQIERSQYLALHDDLTSLANRRLFQDRLASAVERARRTGESMALLQIDLDRFKEVNDLHGHHTGDLLLKTVSRLLDSRVRRSDTIARTGGDEFCLILEEPSNRHDAELVAQSLVQLLSEPFEVENKTLRVGASIGVALFPEDAQDAESLCIEADLRMYQSKQTRKEAARERSSGRFEPREISAILG